MKKVYVEITNNCNLNCSFCIHNQRKNKFMEMDEFKIILEKLKGTTKYLYFHVLGEPLVHPDINAFIDIASEDYFINITTNGYLIKKIKDNKNIRQLNISLHSFTENGNKSVDEYMNDIFEVADNLSKHTYINYRLWVGENKDIIKILEEKYNKEINGSKKLSENVFIDIEKTFIWPDLNNKLKKIEGKCYGLKDHIGILVDGTIIPCCLDSKGDINLGNIFKDDINDILNSSRVETLKNNLSNGKRTEALCQHCGFKE